MVSTSYEPALSPKTYAANAPAAAQLPSMAMATTPVSPKAHLHKSTGLYSVLAWVLFIWGALAVVGATFGLAIFGFALTPLFDYFRHRKLRAVIRGSGVQVGPEQMPRLHALVESYSRRLGLPRAPEVYIVEDSMQNGVAVKLGTRDIVLLTDDVVWGALNSGDPRTLGFVIGHELAHIALGHTKTLRALFRTVFRPLARADEHTADAIAAALVGDATVAARGLALLTVGPQLMPYLNEDALLRQAREVWADKQARKAERQRAHPLLLRRIAYVAGAR